LRPGIAKMAAVNHPDWKPDGYLCLEDLNRLRAEYVQSKLTADAGALTHLEADVARAFREEKLISRQLKYEARGVFTFGQRMADRMARFGGSWRFLLIFTGILILWIGFNGFAVYWLHSKPFDPYPFILLNLALSCLAAVQAPVIMMSQNRQEARDRKRAENDYKVNLKAELEIRSLHEKFDHLLDQQWQYLIEIQQIQVELLQELAARRAE
jgi:uncharacterized membrane protein